MPKDKDRKKIIRARMALTGEAYTTARRHVLGAPSAATPKEWIALAGHTDESLVRRTGRTWREWVTLLDAEPAAGQGHTALARRVGELGADAWWAQAVTVGYERIRGLRVVNQTSTGEFRTSKSRTLSAPIATLHAAFAAAAKRRTWLPGGVVVRSSIRPRLLRLGWPDGTHVEVALVSKPAGRTTVRVTHGRLAGPDDVAARKAYWGERLDALASQLR